VTLQGSQPGYQHFISLFKT